MGHTICAPGGGRMFSVSVLLIGVHFFFGQNTGMANFQYADDVVLKRQGVSDVYLDPISINDWTIKDETNVIVHSFLGKTSDPWVVQSANHFLSLDHNVILVNYETSAGKIYKVASVEAVSVGNEVGALLANLTNKNALDPSTVDVVGFSLGAQVAGFIGQSFQSLTGRKLNKITGLDPAGRDFEGRSPSEQLDSSDAVFVQVIHTDSYGIGNRDTISDVDFIINNPKREFQPGCTFNGCSHWRAVDLYLESIGEICPLFKTRKCGNSPKMTHVGLGYNADPSIKGKVCVDAPGESSPLCGI